MKTTQTVQNLKEKYGPLGFSVFVRGKRPDAIKKSDIAKLYLAEAPAVQALESALKELITHSSDLREGISRSNIELKELDEQIVEAGEALKNEQQDAAVLQMRGEDTTQVIDTTTLADLKARREVLFTAIPRLIENKNSILADVQFLKDELRVLKELPLYIQHIEKIEIFMADHPEPMWGYPMLPIELSDTLLETATRVGRRSQAHWWLTQTVDTALENNQRGPNK